METYTVEYDKVGVGLAHTSDGQYFIGIANMNATEGNGLDTLMVVLSLESAKAVVSDMQRCIDEWEERS